MWRSRRAHRERRFFVLVEKPVSTERYEARHRTLWVCSSPRVSITPPWTFRCCRLGFGNAPPCHLRPKL
jgi:hypothetical protein